MNRARLLRAWVEIGAMLVDYQRRFREHSRPSLARTWTNSADLQPIL